MRTAMVLAFTIILTIVADYLLKVSASAEKPYFNKVFFFGASIYGVTAIGWVALMQKESLAKVAVIYSSVTILALALLGIVAFGEKLNTKQLMGIILALSSVIVMHMGEA